VNQFLNKNLINLLYLMKVMNLILNSILKIITVKSVMIGNAVFRSYCNKINMGNKWRL